MKRLAMMFVLVSLFAIGCGAGRKADFEGEGGEKFTLKPQKLVEVTQGEKVNFTIEIENAKAMTKPIELSLKQPPKGVSFEQEKPTIPAGQKSTTLTLRAADDAKAVIKERLYIAGTIGKQSETVFLSLTINKNLETLKQEREQFVQGTNSRVSQIANQLNELTKKLTDPKLSVDKRIELTKTFSELLAQQKRVNMQLESVTNAPVQDWETLKQDMTDTLDAFESKVKEAVEEFNNAGKDQPKVDPDAKKEVK